MGQGLQGYGFVVILFCSIEHQKKNKQRFSSRNSGFVGVRFPCRCLLMFGVLVAKVLPYEVLQGPVVAPLIVCIRRLGCRFLAAF